MLSKALEFDLLGAYGFKDLGLWNVRTFKFSMLSSSTSIRVLLTRIGFWTSSAIDGTGVLSSSLDERTSKP